MTKEQAIRRAKILRAIRSFFDQRGFFEVETPARIAAPAQETQIDAPVSGHAFLRASPELQMKRLLCQGFDHIYQIGPCFRTAECGRRHNPEFTLLEWYETGCDYRKLLRDTEELVRTVIGKERFTYQGKEIHLESPWREIPVREAFQRWAGWDPALTWDADRFDLDLMQKVEPALPQDQPIVLIDYPAPAASLARLKPADPLVAERWEVYIGGLELANAYSELCDPVAQRRRFEIDANERAMLGKIAYPMDEDFFADLQNPGMPPCGGIALGVDRLVMLALDTNDIQDARLFCQRPGELL